MFWAGAERTDVIAIKVRIFFMSAKIMIFSQKKKGIGFFVEIKCNKSAFIKGKEEKNVNSKQEN